ncbi:hypothetical protein R80B4_00051 [Fibrobacteres bacterium R8-0-B4]
MAIPKQKERRAMFAERLRMLMVKNRVNQQKLGDALGLSQQTIQDYLIPSGEGAAPKLENIVAMAEYFDVSCDYLTGVSSRLARDVDVQVLAKEYGLEEESAKTLSKIVYNAMYERKDVFSAHTDTLTVLNTILSDYNSCVEFFSHIYDIFFKSDESKSVEHSDIDALMDTSQRIVTLGLFIYNILGNAKNIIKR